MTISAHNHFGPYHFGPQPFKSIIFIPMNIKGIWDVLLLPRCIILDFSTNLIILEIDDDILCDFGHFGSYGGTRFKAADANSFQ